MLTRDGRGRVDLCSSDAHRSPFRDSHCDRLRDKYRDRFWDSHRNRFCDNNRDRQRHRGVPMTNGTATPHTRSLQSLAPPQPTRSAPLCSASLVPRAMSQDACAPCSVARHRSRLQRRMEAAGPTRATERSEGVSGAGRGGVGSR